ncbi:MAG: ABC transporter permease, partial [Acidobacteria bacterium]|nr:ABC transporter permease [Acidobacteriota bacterium]
MWGFLKDLRLGLRALGRTPVLTAVAALLLALGIGSTTAIFTIIDAVMLRPLRLPEPERVVQVWDQYPFAGPGVAMQIAMLNFQDYEAQNRVFDRMAAIGRTTAYEPTEDGLDTLKIEFVSADLFSILGVEPILGRLFLPEENEQAAAQVAILPYEVWTSRYASDPEIVGKTVTVRYFHQGETDRWPKVQLEIVGVLEPGYGLPPMKFDRRVARFPKRDLIVPLGLWKWGLDNRGMWALWSVARLAPGVTVEQAGADLESISSGIAESSPETSAGYAARVTSLDSLLRVAYGPRLLLLWGAAGFVLILGCANVASLLFGRSLARERELAVRSALGAGRARLVAYLFSESVLLAGLGAVIGLALAAVGRRLLVALVPGGIPGLEEAALDLRAYVFSVAATVGTTLLCGLLPAVRGSRPDVASTLKAGSRGGSGVRMRPLRVLVIAEAVITILLLVGAGLLGSTFLNYLRVDPGFKTERVVSLELHKPPAPMSKYIDRAAEAALFDRLRERLEALPEVMAVAYVNFAPLSGREPAVDFTLADRPPPPPEERAMAAWMRASPGYFEMLKVPLIEGRTFTDADVWVWIRSRRRREREQMRLSIPVIVNQTFAQRYWPDESALGKSFHWGTQNPTTVLEGSYEDGTWDERYPVPAPLEIVGVVGDVQNLGLNVEQSLQYYTPQKRSRSLLVRVRLDGPMLAGTLSAAAEEVDPGELTVTRVTTLEDRFSDAVAVPRFQMLLVAFFAGCSLLMAAVGLFGVMTYSVRRRRQEIGVRIALGARPADIRRLVLGEGVILTATGLGIGILLAMGLSRLLGSLLFGVSPTEPLVFMAGSALQRVVAVVASLWPAHPARARDP